MSYIDHIIKDNIKRDLFSQPLAKDVAEIFDDQASYDIDDYCIYETKLYRFIKIHSGVWLDTDVIEVSVGDEMKTFSNQTSTMNSTLNANTQDISNLKIQVGTLTNNDESIDQDINDIRDNMSVLSNTLKNKADTFRVGDDQRIYIYSGDELLTAIGPFSGGSGGGSGGGESTNSAEITAKNTTGWITTTISGNNSCSISFEWSSIEDEQPTGDGSMTVFINGSARITRGIAQGEISVDVTNYLQNGRNAIRVAIYDVYENVRYINYTINVVTLGIKSSFDNSISYSGSFIFSYSLTGEVEKTAYIEVDGEVIATETTSLTNRQLTVTIPEQTHGTHIIRAWCTADINGETITSNTLRYEVICTAGGSTDPIIISDFTTTTVEQWTNIQIKYRVYDPTKLSTTVILKANDTVVNSIVVNRTEQTWAYRADTIGNLALTIQCGEISKTFDIVVTASSAAIGAVTEGLELYLTAYNRSNGELHPEVWNYNDISATLTGFNYISDGWINDMHGSTILRVAGSARITIPFQIFERDFRSEGKTIEIEFATHNVKNYDDPIISCMSNERGIKITSQEAVFKSEQTEKSIHFKEDEHVRLTYVVEKRSENRLIYTYINGIMSGIIQYPDVDDFSQINPVGISIGSSYATTDIYCIRVYNTNLNREQVLRNWIADTQDVDEMLDRYARNNVLNENGKVVINKLPQNIPYFVLNAAQLPQYKGDKKTITGEYVDPVIPRRSFTFEGCQINVQGTSSAPYYKNNYDLQFKEGFNMHDGSHADNYALKDNVIPFNRFVLKADVASSESANNVELVRLYNDICPYKRPEMVENAKVRWGIDGLPVVVFWHDLTTEEIKFLGKFNYNLPKRAPGPYGYSEDMESWEFQNNTSNLMVYRSDFFDESLYADEDTGETKEKWRFDYEARFPSDEWTDYSKLQVLQSFIYSTYRGGATNQLLETPIVYPGTRTENVKIVDSETGAISYEERTYRVDVTYTNDTADYRLAKFKTEFGNYAEVDSFIFYYLYTELFLMIDSRAKNLFIGFSGGPTDPDLNLGIDRKAVAEPYDMDTAIGTNNSGQLYFGYNLEDTDYPGGQSFFDGVAQYSVLWNNIRDAFGVEIKQMMQQLRSSGLFSYDIVEQRYENHQKIWPEAIWNEDAYTKYIEPLIDVDAVRAYKPNFEMTAFYLPMLQGSKEEQRKWWLSNRFQYMDSKWNTGDARSVITLRAYAKANITVTPYADIYPMVKYGSYTVSQRGAHGQATTLVCPVDDLGDTEVYIYSAAQLASVGDLSGLQVGYADFAPAIRLQNIKIGDVDENYENSVLLDLHLGNNILLETIDCRKCINLGGSRVIEDTTVYSTTPTIDLSGCVGLKNIYFDDTSIKGVSLPNGALIEVLHLPQTITNLTLMNLKNLSDLTVPSYENVTTLRVENCSSEVDPLEILEDIPANSRVRIIGFDMTVESVNEIEDFYSYLDTMRGLDENGNTIEISQGGAQVSGVIHIESMTGAEKAAFEARYPYITIDAAHTTSYRYFKTWDDSSEVGTVSCIDGVPQTTAPSVPQRTSTAQYNYTAVGWSTNQDAQSANYNHNALTTSDITYYAAYSRTVRTYTITWKNSNGTTLETDNNVPYGNTPTYNGSTPVDPSGNSSPFVTWTPAISSVVGNTTYTASYKPTWTVTFKDQTGTTTLQTKTVVDGNTATYTGSTPTNADATTFLGWAAAANANEADTNILKNIKANKTVYAAHEFLVEDIEITDTWDQIIQHIDAGDYSTRYRLGNYKPLDLGETYGTVNMQIVAIDGDNLASGGKAPLSFIAKELLLQKQQSFSTLGNNYSDWETDILRQFLMDTIYPLLPLNIKNRILNVQKTFLYGTSTTKFVNDKLWVPSARELDVNSWSIENTGIQYNKIYKNVEDRIKECNKIASRYWTRSGRLSTSNAGLRCIIAASGTVDTNTNGQRDEFNGVCLGFCLGLEPETITDSWDTILANTNPSATYSIGDTKSININGENHLMQIVAFDADDMTAGGKAKISWLMKDLMNTGHRMNATDTNAGSWPATEMRTWLRDTILPTVNSNIRSHIVDVNKTYYSRSSSSTAVISDNLWIPSAKEMANMAESSGISYITIFTNNEDRIKKKKGSAYTYWLRSDYSGTLSYLNLYFWQVQSTGGLSTPNGASQNMSVCIGFCTN